MSSSVVATADLGCVVVGASREGGGWDWDRNRDRDRGWGDDDTGLKIGSRCRLGVLASLVFIPHHLHLLRLHLHPPHLHPPNSESVLPGPLYT